jgi:hypothetical protein
MENRPDGKSSGWKIVRMENRPDGKSSGWKIVRMEIVRIGKSSRWKIARMEIVRMEIVRMGNSPARTHAAGGRPERASLQWMGVFRLKIYPDGKMIPKLY